MNDANKSSSLLIRSHIKQIFLMKLGPYRRTVKIYTNVKHVQRPVARTSLNFK